MIGDIHYRAEVLWGLSHRPEIAIYYREYIVQRESDNHYWYASEDDPTQLMMRAKYARRRFARPSKEEALKDLLARLSVHETLLEGRLRAVRPMVYFLKKQMKGESND